MNPCRYYFLNQKAMDVLKTTTNFLMILTLFASLCNVYTYWLRFTLENGWIFTFCFVFNLFQSKMSHTFRIFEHRPKNIIWFSSLNELIQWRYWCENYSYSLWVFVVSLLECLFYPLMYLMVPIWVVSIFHFFLYKRNLLIKQKNQIDEVDIYMYDDVIGIIKFTSASNNVWGIITCIL